MLTKVCIVKAMIFPIVMDGYGCWTIMKGECQRIDIFELCAGEDSWEFFGLQGDQPSQSKGNKPGILIGRTDTEAPILWPPDAKSQLIGKDLDDGKDWRQKEKGTTEDEMVGWYHRLNGHEFEQTPGVGDGQKSLASMGSQRVGHDWMTELNWTEDVSLLSMHNCRVSQVWCAQVFWSLTRLVENILSGY